jgi:hypothetical protein
LRSLHTNNLPALLQELGISLAVSTYQAGKLVLVRPEGDCLFSVRVLPGVRSPELIHDHPALLADAFIVPEEALCAVPAPLCHVAHSLNGALPQGVLR